MEHIYFLRVQFRETNLYKFHEIKSLGSYADGAEKLIRILLCFKDGSQEGSGHRCWHECRHNYPIGVFGQLRHVPHPAIPRGVFVNCHVHRRICPLYVQTAK